jgi:uncharacterized protein (DUF58 family)
LLSSADIKIEVRTQRPLRTFLMISLAHSAVQPSFFFAHLALWLTLIGISLLLGWYNIRSIYAAIEAPPAAFAWEPLPVAVTLHNRSTTWAARDLLLAHSVPDGLRMRSFSYQAKLDPEQSLDLMPYLKLPRRGKWQSYIFRFESTFPFNLLRWRLTQKIDAELLGLPRIGELRRADDMLPQHLRMQLDKPAGRQGGEEFYALRAWRPGMSQRQVHWKASAKRRRLLVRENQAISRPRVHVVLHAAPADGRKGHQRADFERAVNFAATLTEHLLRRHQPMHFTYLSSTQPLQLKPRAGRQGLNHVLTELAQIRPDERAPKALPASMLKRDAVMVITAANLALPAGWQKSAKVFDVRKRDINDVFREARALPSRTRLAQASL